MNVDAALLDILATDPVDLTELSLVIARLDTPRLDPAPTRAAIAALVDRSRTGLAEARGDIRSQLEAVGGVVFGPGGLRPNRLAYHDVRNCLLPAVMGRRLGMPITLAVVYITVARQVGLDVAGVSFPGHFLMRATDPEAAPDGARILDPFDAGRLLDREALQRLFIDVAGPEAVWTDTILAPCTPRDIAIRMLNNLKRLYVAERDFAHAWGAADVLVALDPAEIEHRRDRGLLAYHLDRYTEALADLEAYLGAGGPATEESERRSQLWEHIGALRRRVAALN